MPPVSKRHHLKYIIQSSCDFIYEEVGGLDHKILHFSDNFNPFSGLNRPPTPPRRACCQGGELEV